MLALTRTLVCLDNLTLTTASNTLSYTPYTINIYMDSKDIRVNLNMLEDSERDI